MAYVYLLNSAELEFCPASNPGLNGAALVVLLPCSNA
jgi:hypothetical protein